jgi:Mg2+-importing ATPase
MDVDGSTRHYWSCNSDLLIATLGSSRSGLTGQEAQARLAAYGKNTVAVSQTRSVAWLLLRQFESPLVLILVFGAIIALILKEWTDATIVLLIVAGSTLLAFTQEYRASNAMARLRERLALTVATFRDGTVQPIEAQRIVPGDVVKLSAGNLVPADGVIVECRDFLVSEAALTGESFPVEKATGAKPMDAPLAQRSNCVYLGTSVRSGTADVLIVHTGLRTEFGRIAGKLAKSPADTEFARGLRDFGFLLTKVMMVMVLFVLTINLLLHRPMVDSLLFAVALAVGLSPELLPAIVSVTLAAGARRMAKGGVIVRRLEAIENLGSIDTLCTDKTGTLTSGVVELTSAVNASGEESHEVRSLALSNASLQTGIANPLDAAICADAKRRGLGIGPERKIDEIPYDFVRKCLTIVVSHERAREHTIITKGAFDNVLDCCSDVVEGRAVVVLDTERRERLQAYYRGKGSEGFRVLGLATRKVAARGRYGREDEAGMAFAGFLLFFDPLKEGVQETIRELARLGIMVKIITGDNRHVAAHVGGAIGLDPSRLLTGGEISHTRNEALWHLAETTDIFAEVDPQQKERIVQALQKRDHVVAYMGDGINDAPALHAADVGVSVDHAVDIARESADVVLLRQDLGVLKSGVVDGRRTFANTLKYIALATSANFGNMISMALATIYVPFFPLAAKQILLNNFLSDFPSMAIASDHVDPEATERAQRWNISHIKRFMMAFGLVSTVFDLMTFYVLLEIFHATEPLFQSTWFLVSVLTEIAVVLVLRTHLPCWRSRPSPLLLTATIAVGMLAVLLPYLPPTANAFSFVPIPLPLLLTSLLVVLSYVATAEVAKRLFYGYPRPRPPA